jgi:hypothetical protein
MMLKCPKCSATDLDPAKFCSYDGALLEPMPICQCGYTMLEHFSFCPKCGVKLNPKEAPRARQPQEGA